MKNSSARLLLASLLVAAPVVAQQPAARITSPIVNADRVPLTGSRPPLADPALDRGAVSPAMKLQGMTLVFSLSPSQKSELEALIVAQSNPSSPLYHQWLTPETYAARFGAADSDIAAAEAWLQSQGFSVDSVARSRNRIFFSGNAGQVESAFGAPLHNFSSISDHLTHYAPAADFTLPRALASVVMAIGNVSSFRPHAHVKLNKPMAVDGANAGLRPNFTSGQTGSHFTGPGDINVVYDVNPVYNAGYTGIGQTIVLIGQSAIYPSDVLNFQNASGITPAPKTPIYLLMPGTGTAAFYTNDEAESDLDVEYASTIGKGAQTEFIYTGNSGNYNVFNSLQYAVDNHIGTIISSSYGACEPSLGLSSYQQLDAIIQQGVSQGQTILSAAGDDGSTDCASTQLAVDYPASSAYVTAMGGSEFPLVDTSGTNASTYWSSNGTTDVTTSAKSYIPEQVWNDDVAETTTASGGGGVSIFTSRPIWQSFAVAGVAIPYVSVASPYRLVPDISLVASNFSAPLIYCSSDPSTLVTGSCSFGFRDINDQYLTTAGGTSFDGPIFSGMLAMINQATGATTGAGLINPTLYALAADPTLYARAFHDITSGGNQCLAGSSICGTGSDTTSYAATTGYDEASGLGSIDLNNLLTAWSGNYFVLTSATTSIAHGVTTGSSTITVTPHNGFTGTLSFTASAPSALTGVCYSIANATINNTAAATTTLNIVTGASSCPTGYSPLLKGAGGELHSSVAPAATPHLSGRAPRRAIGVPVYATFAGLLLVGFFKRRSRRTMGNLLSVVLLASVGLSATYLAGCSSSATAAAVSTGSTGPTNIYTVTVTGTSTTNSAVTSTTTFQLTIN